MQHNLITDVSGMLPSFTSEGQHYLTGTVQTSEWNVEDTGAWKTEDTENFFYEIEEKKNEERK